MYRQLEHSADLRFELENTIYGQGFFPFRCYLNSGILRCTFKRISVMNGIEIKALTYHDLRFKEEAGKIKAKVVFDV